MSFSQLEERSRQFDHPWVRVFVASTFGVFVPFDRTGYPVALGQASADGREQIPLS